MSDRQFSKLNADANMQRHNERQKKSKHRQLLEANSESRYESHRVYQRIQKKPRLDFIKEEPDDNSVIIKKEQPSLKQETGENLSFCGCGFLGIYHVGVATSFRQYAPHLSNYKVSGSSAGALAAVAHICGDVTLAQAASDFLRTAIEARSRSLGPFHPAFDINAILTESLQRGLPEDVHLRASGRLHVSLTRVYDGENVIINKFDSKEDVIQAIICSCFIPFWSGIVAPKYKGITYTDGGFSNNLLILDDKTITVSPFAGEADICPQDDSNNLISFSLSNTSVSLTPHNLYRVSNALMPPPTEFLTELCARGFADGIRFLQKMKFISFNETCLDIRSSFTLTEITEEIIEQEEETSQFPYNTNNDNNIPSQRQMGLFQSIGCCYGKDLTSRLSSRIRKTTMRTTSSTGCFVNGLLATAAAGGERIVIDIERTLPLLIDRIWLYPFLHACASAALVYLMDCLKSGAKVGEKHQRRVVKLVQYFSI